MKGRRRMEAKVESPRALGSDQKPDEQRSKPDEQRSRPDEQGAYLGSQPELGADSIVGGPQRNDERVAGEATQSTGPAGRGANPDEGWSDWPEGHREGRPADDDMVRRKG